MNIQDILSIQKSQFSSRVFDEVFPLFKNNLSPDSQLFLAVSSGADSMTLACLTVWWRNSQEFPLSSLHILHCNHKIRPESEKESRFIQDFFSWLDVQIFTKPDSIPTDENSLRNWRYESFKNKIFWNPQEKSSAILLLWHNLNDRIETTILNLQRGCSIDGFLNMHSLQQNHPLLWKTPVFRPLLSITKNQILDFISAFSISFFEDSTNSDLSISKRNFIRHEIIAKLAENTKFLNSMKNIYDNLSASSPHSNLNKSGEESSIVQIRKKLWITHNLRSSQIQERENWLKTGRNSRKQLQNYYFFLHNSELFIQQSDEPFFRQKTLPDAVQINELWIYKLGEFTVNVDQNRFLGWTLRFPQKGDRFAGKTRHRRCLNQKIPIFKRNFIPVVYKDDKIIHMRKSL